MTVAGLLGTREGRNGAIALVWVFALVMSGLAASAARDIGRASGAGSQVADLSPPPLVQISRMPVARSELQKLSEILKSGKPSIRVVVEGTPDAPVLSIAADRLDSWETWQSAVAETLSSIPGGEWSFVQLCSGRECPQVPLSATLTVVRRAVPTP